MPIDDYQCGCCGFRFSGFHLLGESGGEKCPQCGNDAFRKLRIDRGFRKTPEEDPMPEPAESGI